ncbi:hypothetical protein PTKIN_Ptkin16aG0060700 [Pterospermum kingtungense]
MAEGKKRLAVLVGCNYTNTKHELQGCINDVVAMRDLLLKRFGFDDNHVELLTDAPGSLVLPKGANIRAALNDMVDKAEPGDVLFFHFSGRGMVTSSGLEAIVPCDFNLITNMDLRQLIRRLPKGVSFTILSDSSHSGGLVDKNEETSFTILSDSCYSGGLIEKEIDQIGLATIKNTTSPVFDEGRRIDDQSIHERLESAASVIHGIVKAAHTSSDNESSIGSLLLQLFGVDASLKFRPNREMDLAKPLNEDDGILLSGCQANETSADMPASASNGGKAYGAFTYAVLQVLRESQDPLSNRELVMKARKVVEEQGYGQHQHPCLYCSDGNANAAFLVPGHSST